MKKIRIIAVDDHPVVLQGISIMLEGQDQFDFVATFNHPKDVLTYLEKESVDIAIVDFHMPEMDGAHLTKLMISKQSTIKVIALTMYREIQIIRQVLQAGAHGYLLKNIGQQEFLEALLRVYQGKQYLSKEVAEMVIADFSGLATSSSSSPDIPNLTRREKDVLRLILEEKTTLEIAKDLFISFGTVESHRRNMMSKLGVKNTAGLVKLAVTHSLV